MIARLVRWFRLVLAVLGLVWVARGILRWEAEVHALVGMLEYSRSPLEGVDPVNGDRYGVRLTPLRSDELRQAREREAAIRRDPELFTARG